MLRDENMEQNKLEQIYNSIEKIDDYSISFWDHSVSKEFKNIRDNTSSSDISKIAQLEMDCFNFMIKNGKLISHFLFVNSETNGTVFIPDIETFDEESYNYIKSRIKNTQNPIIISRYAMILWEGNREWEYAKLAVDENLKIINELKTTSDLKSLTNYIINTYVTSKEISYRNDEIKDILLNLIKDPNKIESYYSICDLIEFIINQKKNFSKEDLKDINVHVWKITEDVNTKNDHLLMRVIKAGEKINNICSIKDNKWIELKAETYEKLAKKEENNSSKILHLLQAIKLNKELKNEKKKKELIREYEKTKEKIEMPTISYKVPYFYEMLLELEEAAKRMGEEDSETILAHLMFNNDLLVGNYENLTKLTADANEKSPLFFGMTKILYDERGHVKEQYRTEEEREHFALNQNYEHYIMLSSRYLDNLIHYAIINKKISYDSIMSFIKDKTWLGKKSEKNTLMFNHIFYISCIIKQYFQEYYIYLNYPQYNPQFVLTMDSLSLKIEGIIRDFCKILNISTTRINADNTSEEKTLNQLLKEEKLKEMIGENDLFFLKFVLIDQGFNLRNKIAHSLMQPSEYNETYVNLLILALFRLLKYKLK